MLASPKIPSQLPFQLPPSYDLNKFGYFVWETVSILPALFKLYHGYDFKKMPPKNNGIMDVHRFCLFNPERVTNDVLKLLDMYAQPSVGHGIVSAHPQVIGDALHTALGKHIAYQNPKDIGAALTAVGYEEDKIKKRSNKKKSQRKQKQKQTMRSKIK